MPRLPGPLRLVSGHLQRAGADSLVRNSLFLMSSTVVTAGLGYVFWVLAAHEFTRQAVGIGSAVISLCSTAALLTYLGSSAILIERLPGRERSSKWTVVLIRVCAATAAVTAVVTAALVPVLLASRDYRLFFSTAPLVVVAVVGAAAWTLVNLLGAAFIAARRAGRLLSIQALISSTKILLLFPLAAVATGARGLVEAWVASAVIGIGVGVTWLVPGMGLGRRPADRTRRRSPDTPAARRRQRRPATHRRAPVPPSVDSVWHLVGQHLTSVGGAVTPLVLPVLVVLRLGVTLNAYFYITWMVGGAFFMVSPSVASAVFAEGVRAGADLRPTVGKAFRVIALVLAPAMAVMIVGGKFILGLFGTAYAVAGYGLLILLAISALPDAVSNVAVVICRVTRRLGYSAALNLAILIMTLAGSWVLMPRLGIVGVGVAWLGAQTVGAIASLPAFAHIRKPVVAGMSASHYNIQLDPDPVPDPWPGLAALMELARRQSEERARERLLS